jgi:hypothetical protein
MSELSFLLDLLLNDKLSKPVREKITARVKEVEGLLSAGIVYSPVNTVNHRGVQQLPPPKVINGAVQSPSTVAAMERQAAGLPSSLEEPAAVVVASVAAAQAIQSRNQALSAAISGKPEAGRTSPRKF